MSTQLLLHYMHFEFGRSIKVCISPLVSVHFSLNLHSVTITFSFLYFVLYWMIVSSFKVSFDQLCVFPENQTHDFGIAQRYTLPVELHEHLYLSFK